MKKIFFLFLLFVVIAAYVNPSFENDLYYERNFSDFFKWRLQESERFWPEWVEINTLDALPKMQTDTQIIYINHSTFLIRTGDYNILIDPIFSDYASPVSFAGPKRVHFPVLEYHLLPKIDFVLLTHNHYDHMDLTTLKNLYVDFNPTFIVGSRNGFYLKQKLNFNINAKELHWGESAQYPNLNIYFEESQHWSKRGLFDTNKTLWGSFVIQSNDKNIYHSGDSGYSDHYKEIGEKFESFNFVMLPIGAYLPRWFMKFSHLDSNEAMQAYIDLNAEAGVAMHFNTFALGDDDFYEVRNYFNREREKFKLDNFYIPINDFVFDVY